MSNVEMNNKAGHPVAGIILGIAGIGVSLLMTLLFGVIAGAVAGALGIGAALLGIFARKHSHRGMGAIVTGALAIVLAFSMTFASVNTMKTMKEVAESSGVAPTFARYMDNPYMGLTSVIANATKGGSDAEATKTIQNELDALNRYMGNKDNTTTEKTADSSTKASTGITAENSVGVSLSIGG